MKKSVTDRSILILFLLIFINLNATSAIRIRKGISLDEKQICRNTVQGRYLLTDDNGHVCDALSVDTQSRCCPGKGEKYSCQGCSLDSQCCRSYEYCVSCCQNPTRTRREEVRKVKIAKPLTAGTYVNVFDFCAGRCRHNSESVVHENAYLSDFHHCFSLPPNTSAGATVMQLESRLLGIDVTIGRQAESCDSVCKSKGKSCVQNKLSALNQCEILEKYMSCKGLCLESIGSDQPAKVVDDAPKHLNPGACLYTRQQAILSCDGADSHTRRLCPCA